MRYEDYDSLILSQENAICYIADYRTYDLIHLTAAAMGLFGLKSPEEYLGKKCYKLLQGLDAPCPFCTNGKLKMGESYCWVHFNDLLQRWMDIEDTLLEIDGRLCRLEHAREISIQEQQMKRLSDQLTLEQILVKCIQTLATVDDYNVAFQSFLEQLGRFYRANRAYIFEIDFAREVVNNTYEWCAPHVSTERERLQDVPMSYISDWLKRFRETGEFFITSLEKDLERDAKDYEILNSQGIESLLAAPLMEGGTIVGFIGVDDPTNSTEDLTLLRASSNFVVEELKKRRLIKKLEYASYTDMLTGLHNRNRYMEALKAYGQEPPRSLGVVFADVNGMKTVNDSCGHEYGDKLLIRVADILRTHTAGQAYRIGGDEFVLLFVNMDRAAFQQEVQALRARLAAEPDCDVSLGCVWNQGEMDVTRQIIHADELMYAEKQSYYKGVLSQGQPVRIGINDEVSQEIEGHQFLVYYQPQLNIRTGQIVGAEALVRKRGRRGELIQPDKFIPYYEIEGVIRHIDLFVLEEVCRTMQTWQADGIELNVAVNFSRVTLMEPNIVQEILEICGRYGVSPKNLTIEVTESISRLEYSHQQALVADLLEHGFTISLDDFGSQYSNLAILSDMNFHTVKIDKALVDRLTKSQKGQIIIKNTIRMCQELEDTHTMAEGIETAEQAQLLSQYACEYGQGFYYSEPLPLERFDALLRDSAAHASAQDDAR